MLSWFGDGRSLCAAILLHLLQHSHGHQLTKHIQEHLDERADHTPTLIWAVSLSPGVGQTPEQVEGYVSQLTTGTGLLYRKAFAEDLYHYLLYHESHDYFRTPSHRVLRVRNVSLHPSDHEVVKARVHKVLEQEAAIHWYSQQILRPRVKRSIVFKDPAYPMQWHLENKVMKWMDINVTGVWERNITGHGVTVAVVDDGLEWRNPDLYDNYSSEGSIDLDSNDDDPSPSPSGNNHHGTRCAGEIAAVANTHCAVGVAFRAKVSGIRVLDGTMTDSMEAAAFDAKLAVNDIYSCSWGPEDDGKTVDGPHALAKIGLKRGVDFGRSGYGSIFVVASGNGGRFSDNCNFDGYANSVYTITIGAVDETGAMPYYAEECAAMLAVTFSSGQGAGIRSITTTDTGFGPNRGCTSRHSGTSAAAPIAAGIVALMLEARPCLSWRDVQHILVMTAVKVDIDVAHWSQNSAGLHHSHKHGFGLMDTWRLVNTAKIWPPVPWLTSFSSHLQSVYSTIPKLPNKLDLSMTVTRDNTSLFSLNSLEHIVVTVMITHPKRGQLDIRLVCPSGMESVLASYRDVDRSTSGFQLWPFSTVRCWGESPVGVYRLLVRDKDLSSSRGVFISWQLTLYGSSMTTEDVKQRLRTVHESYSGVYLNDSYSPPCPRVSFKQQASTGWVTGKRLLKFLTLTGVFLLVMALYQTFEYMWCYKDAKEEERHSGLARQAEYLSLATGGTDASTEGASDRTHLLADTDDIPLQTFQSCQSITTGENDCPNESSHCSQSCHDDCSGSSGSDQGLSETDQMALVVDMPDQEDVNDNRQLVVDLPP